MTSDQAEGYPLRLEIQPDTQVAVVTLDRPPVNAINMATQLAITETFDDLSARRDVNAVVFTAAGRVFSAGKDLREPQAATDERPLDPGRVWRDARSSILNCAVPVIGAVNGAAIGAGVGLVSLCDIVIASENARFGLAEINVGLLGGGAAAMRLVGRYKMRRMYFTGEMVSAEELYRLGGVESVVPADALMTEAVGLATTIASKSPIALRLAKESLNRIEEFLLPYEASYRTEQDYTNRLGTFEDSKEGTAAFLEKRQPQWKWR